MLTYSEPDVQADLLWTDQDLAFFRQHDSASRDELLSMLISAGNQHHRSLVHQMLERRVIRHKLPFFYQMPELVYPPRLSLEQASSEVTAEYKASLCHGERFIDLTAGMGIDSRFFAKRFNEGILVERSASLARITSHNLALMKCGNLKLVAGVDAETFLSKYDGKADLLYLDPARRDGAGGKVIRLQDCEPDPVPLLPAMFAISDRVLIKTSPLLDIHAACTELQHVSDVYVVAVDNECKELLFLLQKEKPASCRIHAVNLGKQPQPEFLFEAGAERELVPEYSGLKTYLYEPNAAIMKSGGFKAIAGAYALFKLHPHSHLYTSDRLREDFPGRCFEVLAKCKVSKPEIRAHLPGMQAHVSLRNFPGSVQDFRKKMGITEGGDTYLFVTTLSDESRAVIIGRKV